MQNGDQRALVIGGGIGGMATAIALRKQGVAVEIAEINPKWTVYGAGLTITGPTLRAFRDLGLLERIGQSGFFSKGSHLYLYDGTLLTETLTAPIEEGLPSAGGIMRPKLHEIMIDEVRQSEVGLRIGVTAESFEQDEHRVRVTFTDGSEGDYALVVAADGIYSTTRQRLFADAVKPTYCGQMSWRVVAPRPPEMDVAHFFFGHANSAGIIPCSQTEMYAFVLQPEPNPKIIPEDEKVEAVKALLADFGGSMAVVRDGLTEASSIVPRPFEFAFQPRPWNLGRVIVIGDAAHATTPHLASGAGIAVEDALVLADELARHGWDVPAALAAFTDRRFERCKFVVEESRAIAVRQLDRAPPQEIGALMGQAMHHLAGAI